MDEYFLYPLFFNEIDLKPGNGFLFREMSSVFVDTVHGMRDIILDATEFKFQTASNYELNSLMFSNYKDTTTGKSLIGIATMGWVFFLAIYVGDQFLTQKLQR